MRLLALLALRIGLLKQTRHLLLVMAILWSVVQFPMLGTITLEMLIACRIIPGSGEGPAAPAASSR